MFKFLKRNRDRRPQAVVVWCTEGCGCWHVRPIDGPVPHELKFTSLLRAADQANVAGYQVVA